MFKKMSFFLVIGLLVSQLMVFSFGENISEVTEWVKVQVGELTQGEKNDIYEEVIKQLNVAIVNAESDIAAKTSLNKLNNLVSESIIKLDGKQAVDLIDIYRDVVVTYMKSGNMSKRDVQWSTDEFISIVGKNIKEIEDVNIPRTAYILEEIVNLNGSIQGTFSVSLNNTFASNDLNETLLNIEKAHRVTTSQLSSYNYNYLGRELPKQLVLKSSGEGVNVTLTADLLKRLIADQVMIVVEERGFTYEVPVAFMSKHVGDFKIVITATPVTTLTSYGDMVNDGRVELVVARNIKIGYPTNKEMITVKLLVEDAIGETYIRVPYAIVGDENNRWKKLIGINEAGKLSSVVKGTTVLGVAKYYPTYTDLEGHWAENRISILLGWGIADRINTQVYNLDGVMTRGEFVKMLINIVGTEGKSKNTFVDVPNGSPYADIIESVIYYGFTIGVTGDEFRPDTPLSREDLVALVAKMHDVKYGYTLDSGFLTFRDMNDIAPYAKEAVSALKEAGYISGYADNTFRPKNLVTRAEAISVLFNVLME